MSKFTTSGLIAAFSQLGTQLSNPDEQLSAIIANEKQYNAWFTPESVSQAIHAAGQMLDTDDLIKWLSNYHFDYTQTPKRVGLILAGNIPLVGFHDVLCVLISGNYALIKSSSQDARLIKHVLQMLCAIEPEFESRYSFVERLENFDAVIATGSNNSSRYFDYYFGKVPNIIRKNRNSLAVLTGEETADQLHALGHDIFDYYGLGCRNVSKLLVPRDYKLDFFFESIEDFNPIIHHHKYNNNYGYNKSIYLVNSDKHFDNGFLLLKQDERLSSPLAVLFFDYYEDLTSLKKQLDDLTDNIQCVVSAASLQTKNQLVNFGESQKPALWDYADNVDTMAFLVSQ
jgi:hypothetical protein